MTYETHPKPGWKQKLAPRLSQRIFESCVKGDYVAAETAREQFLPLEDMRDAWNPAKVLHHAVELAGIAQSGPLPPYLSPLSAPQLASLEPVAMELVKATADE